jgi:hypothetical protein
MLKQPVVTIKLVLPSFAHALGDGFKLGFGLRRGRGVQFCDDAAESPNGFFNVERATGWSSLPSPFKRDVVSA